MTQVQEKMVATQISLPIRQYAALREAANREGKSMARIVREALRVVLNEEGARKEGTT